MTVDCEFRKWRDKPHWRFSAEIIEQDSFGTWLSALPPTAYSGPRGTGEWSHAFVILVPVADWWIASFNEPGTGDVDVYVDICTPAEWHSAEHASAIDLDLDVIRMWDGQVVLDDEDEFAEHQVSYGYPPDVIARASETAERVLEMVSSRTEPFGSAGAERLATLLQRPYDSP